MCPASSSRNRAGPFTVIGTAASSRAVTSSAPIAGSAAVTWAAAAFIAASSRSCWRASRAAGAGAALGPRGFGLRAGAPPGRAVGLVGGLADHGVDDLDLDQVVRRALQDVAQRGERVHGQALRRLGDQPEHLLA